MRIKMLATLSLFAPLLACGGEEPPPPQAPPPPPPVASAPPPPASTAETPPPPPAKPTMAELVPVTLKNVTDAFNAHDAAKFAAQFTPDAVDTEYGGMDAHGRDEIQKSIQMFFDMSSDVKGGAASLWSKGNVVAVDWVSAGTMTGDFMGVKASKKPIGGHRLVISTLNDDGLMTSTHTYADMGGIMAQMKGAKDAPEVPSVPATTAMHMAKGGPDDDKLVDWLKTLQDTLNKDDVKAAAGILAPEGDFTAYFAGGKVFKAGKEFEKFNTDFFKAIPKAQFATTTAWAGGDGFLVAERTISGTMKGKMGPVPPTNKDVTIHVAEVFQPTADGKVTHVWVFGNMGELMPPPKAPPPPKEAGKDKDKGAAPKAAPAAAPAAPAAAPKK